MTKTSTRVQREIRRFSRQVGNLSVHGRFNPFTRMRRINKPAAIEQHPELEIESSLEFIAESVARRHGQLNFVLIGAFDGILDAGDSLPRLAIKHQWRGILVEPQPVAFERLRQACADQSCFTLENVAIGDRVGTMDFFTTSDGASKLASFDRGHLLRFGIADDQIVPITVPVETLSGLLRQHGIERLHLLQIDTEGFDGQIIHSIDFETIKPDIIRYEHLNMVERERSEIIRYLAQHGYRFLLEDNDTIAVRS